MCYQVHLTSCCQGLVVVNDLSVLLRFGIRHLQRDGNFWHKHFFWKGLKELMIFVNESSSKVSVLRHSIIEGHIWPNITLFVFWLLAFGRYNAQNAKIVPKYSNLIIYYLCSECWEVSLKKFEPSSCFLKCNQYENDSTGLEYF